LPEQLASLVPGVELAEARKAIAAVHRTGALPERAWAGIRRSALTEVRRATSAPELRVLGTAASSLDPFVKYTLSCPDGGVVETVRVPLEKPGRYSVCVSSQLGCGLKCAFCATGRMGLSRSLEAWEIVDQVRAVRRDLPSGARVHGVVFQGMGEPLANWDAVLAAARVFSEACAQAIDARAITICTSGLPRGIRALARELPNVRLAISIGSMLPGERRSLLPIDAAHPLDDVLEAAGEHVQATGHAPLWAYTLLAFVNDTERHAAALAARALEFHARYGKRPRVSVIPYNSIGEGDPFQRSDAAREARFSEVLFGHGVVPIRRYSGGGDVGAACGQLASRATQSAPPGG
jgi:23S rRNA (adenine2503-C2)-methyltransferase